MHLGVYLFVEGRGFHVEGRGFYVEGQKKKEIEKRKMQPRKN